jgi:predicted alpha/beta-hydrolase family hydrolase
MGNESIHTSTETLDIEVGDGTRVSGILMNPPECKACFVVAHGAGAGMLHPFMENLANDLAARRTATLRYQFPYMERLGRRPDPPALCHATVRSAVQAARMLMPSVPLFAGGKSFGGRMTSQAQAAIPLADVRGLIFLGFPLHPPKEPSDARAEHLSKIRIPMLFVQGARDEFAQPALLSPVISRLGVLATLRVLPDADHSFRVPARSRTNPEQSKNEMLDALARWVDTVAPA